MIKTHLIDPQLETIFRIGAVEAMAGEHEAADGVRVSNAGRAVVLEIAVAARTEEPVGRCFAGRRDDWPDDWQAGVRRLHDLRARQRVVLLLQQLHLAARWHHQRTDRL